jgi:Secretion system C-terminal sorting domain
MKHLYSFLCLMIALSFSGILTAQSPGLIVRPAGGSGITSLNPNGDGYSSQTTAGFTTSDISQSELPYSVIPVAIVEPTGDVSAGPSGGFSDIVTIVDGSGFYLYKDATNIYFRLRIGGIVAGAKGYSVLLDTDNKMGGSGPDADPNYIAPSGTNPGNPGFEYEVVLQTNFQVAVYSIDGSAAPGVPISYSLNTNSQISVALSTGGNNPDYFYDWFVPVSAIGNPAVIRTAVTTLTSPASALQAASSDIYGINDALNANKSGAWQTVVKSQPPISLLPFTIPGPTCTAAPVLSGPIIPGSNITISGTWTRMDASKPLTTAITLYKNGVAAGTATVSSGSTWNIIVASIVAGDIFYAKAQSAGESPCLQSNNIAASSCTSTLATPTLTCASTKGISGTMVSGSAITVYLVPASNASPTSNQVSTGGNLTYPTATSFAFVSNGCTGSPTLATGTYMVVASNASGCVSAARFECITSGSSSILGLSTNTLALPSPIYPYQTSVTGSGATTGDILRLFINGKFAATITATGSSFSFTGLALAPSDQLQIYNSTASCNTQSPVFTVSCFTQAPAITTNTTGNLLTGTTIVNGTSAYPGASVQLYKGLSPSGVAVGVPVTVSGSGVWTVTTTALVGGDNYYATQTVGGCVSAASATATVLTPAVCPLISGTYTETSTAISGTLSSAFTGTIRLYQDGAIIGSQPVTAATTWSIAVPANTLYYNGNLNVSAQATGGAESNGCVNISIGCSSPATPSVTPPSATITTGQNVTFAVTNVSANTWYALSDNTGKSYATSQYRTTAANFSLVSSSFTAAGTYTLNLSADALSGCPASASTAVITVNNTTLAVNFVHLVADKIGLANRISWQVTNESNVKHYMVERSTNGVEFREIGRVAARVVNTASNSYTYLDNLSPSDKSVYYRVVQEDLSGRHQRSKVVVINSNGRIPIQMTPNPAVDKTTVTITASDYEKATLSLVDINGKFAFVKSVQLKEGVNNIVIDNLQRLPRGIYVVKLQTFKAGIFNTLVLQ